MRRVLGLGLLGLAGCWSEVSPGEDPDDSPEASSSTGRVDDGGSTMPMPSGGTADGSGTTAASASSSDDGTDFVVRPDLGEPYECDFWAQDCAPGDKCVPWAASGWTYDGTRCIPVVRDPVGAGEPCHVEDAHLGSPDDCALGAVCWDADPRTLEGECVDLCIGDETEPGCADPSSTCQITGSGLALCLPICNPLDPQCPAGEVCVPVGEGFHCLVDASGRAGAAGEPCESINGCDPSLVCVSEVEVPDCAGTSCCTPVCSVEDAMPPCLLGQACLPYYDAGTAPPGLEALGVCGVP